MSFKSSFSLIVFLALQLVCQHVANAQNIGTTTQAPEHGVRLAQDHFHSVKKTTTSPFAPATDPAVPNVKIIGTNLNAFGVPFKINANDDSFIEVQLYLSRDMGKSWKFYARQGTDRNDFPFQADQDGEYWFSLKTLDRDRRLVPEGDPQAELKIVVDTVKPTLDLKIETDAAGRVICRWNANDQNLLPNTFRIFYQPIDESGQSSEWQRVPVDLNGKARVGVYADQIAWWPDTTERQLNVAVEIRDIAGNVAQAQRHIVVTQSAWRHRSESVAQVTDDNRSRLPESETPASQFSAPSNGPTNGPSNGFSEPMGNPIPADPNSDAAKDQSALHATQRPNHNGLTNTICEDGVCRVVPAQSVPTQSVPTQLIGSEVTQADPPVPEGYTPPPQSHAHSLPTGAGRAGKPGSVVWQSESQKRLSRNRSTTGTTIGANMSPDPSLAPQFNPMQTVARPVTDVPSNPGTMKNVGDQVIGESSTMGQTNQYRGLNSQNGVAIPPPTLLPGQTGIPAERGNSQSNANRYPSTGHPGFETISAESESGAGQRIQTPQSRSGFSNARFSNPGSNQPRDQSDDRGSSSVGIGQSEVTPSGSPLQIIGTKRFRLDYAIDAIDPSGVARVDLWMTRDGRNWNAWGSDPDNQSPFPAEIENDGRYGFRIVVHSKDGLTGQGPSTGDDADMWVLVDTQSPLTHISSVPYGRGNEAGRLVINYSVADDHLTLRPVTLAYSASPQGPWILIGEGLRNESRYAWKPTTEVPDQIYLRIDALDKAGNTGVHILSQAIDVSGLVPRGTIRGVSPVGR